MEAEDVDIEQAKELSRRIVKAIKAIDRVNGFDSTITENEIRFRFDSVDGILKMALNDVNEMVREWQGENQQGKE